jgi:enoyl-CoA hydratase
MSALGHKPAPRGPLGPTFPQACVRPDRMSVYRQHGLPVRKALETEWQTSIDIVTKEGISGAGRLSTGKGRHGDYADIR